jgi:hypothetical protein
VQLSEVDELRNPGDPAMPTSKDLISRALSEAKLKPHSAYWRGYIRGLWKGNYGQDLRPGEELGDGYSRGLGDGYHAGLVADIEKESN